MSFVLPLTMLVVVSLIYLAYAMFLYVHVQNIAEVAADRISESVISENKAILGIFTDEYLSKEKDEEITNEFEEKLNNLCALPGMSSDFDFKIDSVGLNPRILIEIECKFVKIGIFNAKVERKIYSPKEFADGIDVFFEVSKDTGALKYSKDVIERIREAYEEFF